MPEITLNNEKMVSFRLDADKERSLRAFLVTQSFGLHHLINAFVEKVLLHQEGRLLIDYEVKAMEKVLSRAHDLRTHSKYERAEKMRQRHSKTRILKNEPAISDDKNGA